MKRVPTSVLIILLVIFNLLYGILLYAQSPSWQTRGPGGGGSLFFPTINPANDNEFYIACDMSELFHSTDFGDHYTQIPFTKLQVSNTSTYEFTNNNNIAYCIANNGDYNYGVHTIDGGNTWTGFSGEPMPGEDVYVLKADYANPNRFIIDYYGAIYFSNNGGASFSLVKNAANSGAGIIVGGVLFDGNNIYIGTNEGILFSSNGGTSFSMLSTSGIPSTESIFSFAGAKVGGVTRFFCITANSADIYNGVAPYDYYGFAKGVYTLDAGTNVWNSKLSGIDLSNDFVMYVGMAKNDINTVYLGGSDGTTGGNLVIKTSNAGANWNKVFLTTNNQNIRTGWSGQGGDRGWGYGEACFGITVAPNNSNKVLFGDFGFVHKTNDGGVTWQQAYVDTTDQHPANASTPPKKYYHSIGLENTSSWQVYWQDAGNMFGCYSDINGTRSVDGGVTWGFDYTGQAANTTYRIAKAASGTTMFAATSSIHDMYQSTRLQDNILDATDAGGKILYSTNNGAAWTQLHLFSHPVFWIATDPNNANRMYASVIDYGSGSGQGGIWMTNNLNLLASSTWTKLAAPPRTEGHPACIVVLNDGKMVCTFSGRRNSGGTFTASSGVFIYDPILNSWTDVSDAGMQYWTKDIVVDPTDPTQNTWYACVFSGWGGAPNGKGGLYKTINRGSSWTKLTGTTFDRVTSITFNPLMTTQAYLTTETQGLWVSNNMNAAIPTWSLVSDYEFRQPERVFFNPFNQNELWVTSFGNGLKMKLLSGTVLTKLISFTGNRDNSISRLQWLVSDDAGANGFEVDRSVDGVDFERIGAISAGISDQYYFNDTLSAPDLYYRLKLKISNGNYNYSNIIHFAQGDHLVNNIKLLQNPVTSEIRLQTVSTNDNKLFMLLTDVSGKIILQQSISIHAGINVINIPIKPGLTQGVYLLHTEGVGIKKNLRVLISYY